MYISTDLQESYPTMILEKCYIHSERGSYSFVCVNRECVQICFMEVCHVANKFVSRIMTIEYSNNETAATESLCQT